MNQVTTRERIGAWVESPPVQRVIIALILVNAVILGVETSERAMAVAGPVLHMIDIAILCVFVVEIALKLYAQGLRFFRSGWNVFDFFVVGIALVPQSGPFAILRSLRVLRVLRLVTSVRRLRTLVEALLSAVPSLGWVSMLLGLVFYVFSVMGTMLFGKVFPEWFGNLGASLFTLFQIMTLESWSMGIARPVMEHFPFAWLYFASFILVTAFTVLNLFIGIIVSAMQSADREHEEELRELSEQRAVSERNEMLSLLRSLDNRLRALEGSEGS